MKVNNRDFESMQAEYFNAEYAKENTPAMKEDGACCCERPMMADAMPGIVCPPIYECPRETVCHRYICHEVPHIMPCNTRIINHHIYRHTYTPTYSCCEENEVQNVYERRCC